MVTQRQNIGYALGNLLSLHCSLSHLDITFFQLCKGVADYIKHKTKERISPNNINRINPEGSDNLSTGKSYGNV